MHDSQNRFAVAARSSASSEKKTATRLTLTLSPRNEDNPAFWYLFYSLKADISALLNMPNTLRPRDTACPSRAYPRMACISAGELRVNWLIGYFYGNLGAKGLIGSVLFAHKWSLKVD